MVSDAQGCWSAEGRKAYCFMGPAAVGQCAAPPPVVAAIPEPSAACSKIKFPWSENGYTLRPYEATSVAKDMHAWPRVAGDNKFAADKSYVKAAAFSAIPFAVIGLLAALVVLPAAGQSCCAISAIL